MCIESFELLTSTSYVYKTTPRVVASKMNTNTTATVAAATATSSNFGANDNAVFGSLLVLSAAIGIYFGFFDGAEQTTEEYLLGGRRMWPIQ